MLGLEWGDEEVPRAGHHKDAKSFVAQSSWGHRMAGTDRDPKNYPAPISPLWARTPFSRPPGLEAYSTWP